MGNKSAVVAAVGLVVILAIAPATLASAGRGGDRAITAKIVEPAGRPVTNPDAGVSLGWASKKEWKTQRRAVGRHGVTDAEGMLTVDLAFDDAERESIARNGGWMNLTIVTLDRAGNPSAIAALSRDGGGAAGAAIEVAVRERPSRMAGAAVAQNLVACTYYWEPYQYQDRYAQVGELHADYDFTKAQFTYGETADSTIDAMAKSSGIDWYASGSFHIGNTRSSSIGINAPTTNYHWALRTEFTYLRMRLYKDCVGGPTRAWTGSEEVGAIEWSGGGMVPSNPVAQPARNAAFSQTYGAGAFWSRSSSTLTRYGLGAGAFGLTFGIQSGASSEVRFDYAFGSRPTHFLYGNDAKPATSARVFQDTP
jgi:hypothetical protein